MDTKCTAAFPGQCPVLFFPHPALPSDPQKWEEWHIQNQGRFRREEEIEVNDNEKIYA